MGALELAFWAQGLVGAKLDGVDLVDRRLWKCETDILKMDEEAHRRDCSA